MTKQRNRPAGGTKTRQQAAEQHVKTLQKELEKLKDSERKSRQKWTRAYQDYTRAVNAVVDMIARMLNGQQATKSQRDRFTKYQESVQTWGTRSIELTKERDEWREKIAATEAAISEAKTALMVILSEDAAEARANDEIVGQTFSLNDAVVEALHRRNDFLSKHVFPHLFDKNGKLRRQITFTSMDGLRRVVAMVNSISFVDAALAEQAQEEIDRFFDRFRSTMVPPDVQPLYEITKKLLSEKRSFDIGPDLYRFLSIDLDPRTFPELVNAQKFLKQSLRSEKTNSYIRLWKRESRSDKWKPLPQS